MNEETFKKVLYLIFKVIIKNNGFLSQLEIFKYVRILLNNYFDIQESDLIIKIGQGRSEDFKDVLNFTLTILCELALVSQKMENKSFYFKWNSFKGFRKKYLLELLNNEIKFEMSESFEHRAQVYTRNLLLMLLQKPDSGISSDQLEELMKQCGLDNQHRYTEKIHYILKFLDFIIKETPNKDAHQIFTLVNKDSQYHKYDQMILKLNKDLLDERLIKDPNYAEKYFTIFNDHILAKDSLWKDEISSNEKKNSGMIDAEINSLANLGKDKEYLTDQEQDGLINPLPGENSSAHENNELEKLKTPISAFTNETEEEGFALLRGNNWLYYIKKLFCIIGRAPCKYGVALGTQGITSPNYGNTFWHVDVDLGQNRKISKQHALIAYNFQTCTFEIKNLSKKFPIKINGEVIRYNEEMSLSSKSSIIIGSQEFYFLLPL